MSEPLPLSAEEREDLRAHDLMGAVGKHSAISEIFARYEVTVRALEQRAGGGIPTRPWDSLTQERDDLRQILDDLYLTLKEQLDIAASLRAKLAERDVLLRECVSDHHDTAALLRHWLEQVKHVPVTDRQGNIVNGFAATQIPDWVLKQKLEWVNATLARIEAALKPDKEPAVPEADGRERL